MQEWLWSTTPCWYGLNIIIQLTRKEHEFELHNSAYMWVFLFFFLLKFFFLLTRYEKKKQNFAGENMLFFTFYFEGLFYKPKRKTIWRQGTTPPLLLKLLYLSSSQPDTCLFVCSVRPQVPSVLFPIFRRVWLPILGSTFPSGDGGMGNFMSSKFKWFIIGKQFLIQALKTCLIIDKYKI